VTPRELLKDASARLRNAEIPDPETDSALLLSSLTGVAPLRLRLDTDTVLSSEILKEYESLLSRRLSREPLQYILSSAVFYGRTFAVDPRVLIPRPETALLVQWALDEIKALKAPRVLDLCCGSGCIGLTVLAERPDAVVTLSDLSPDALDVARLNAENLGLTARFLQSDLFHHIDSEPFDLIISNPPYIPSADCDTLQAEVLREPRLALDGGADGLNLYRRIAHEVRGFLAPGGLLMMELGIGEADEVEQILKTFGAGRVEVRPDDAGISRMILAQFDEVQNV